MLGVCPSVFSSGTYRLSVSLTPTGYTDVAVSCPPSSAAGLTVCLSASPPPATLTSPSAALRLQQPLLPVPLPPHTYTRARTSPSGCHSDDATVRAAGRWHGVSATLWHGWRSPHTPAAAGGNSFWRQARLLLLIIIMTGYTLVKTYSQSRLSVQSRKIWFTRKSQYGF